MEAILGVILWLIYVLIMAGVIYVACRIIIWAFGLFGFVDEKVSQIIYGIGALIVLYILVSGLTAWPPRVPWPR